MSVTLLQRKVQHSWSQSLNCALCSKVCLLTWRSGTAGRVMKGLSLSSLCKRRCSLSHPSLTHPNEDKARVTSRRWRWEIIRFRARLGGGMMSSPRMTLLAVKVMRYVKGETKAHCSLSSHTHTKCPCLAGTLNDYLSSKNCFILHALLVWHGVEMKNYV